MIIAVAAFATFLATFNETFLNVGFTSIMADFGIGVSTVQWLAGGYMLGAAVMVPVSAFFYHRVPTRSLFLSVVALFVIGSFIGGFASSFTVLLVGRIVQALGTGLLIPVSMNITLAVAPRHRLGSYMGLMGAMTTLGPSLSVILAGGLLSIFSWHSLLWTFAGLSCLLFLSGAIWLDKIAKMTRPHLDALSVALVALALVGIFYGVSTVFGGAVMVSVVSMAIGICALIWFVQRQKQLTQPLIDLRALAIKPFAAGVLVNMIMLITIFAMNVIIPVFLQGSLGATSFNAALTLFPAIALAVVVAPIAGRIYDKHGVKILLPLGFILAIAFIGALSFGANSGSLVLIALLYVPVIVGSALIIGPAQSFALSRLTPDLNAHGVTIMSTGFQIAGCIGASFFSGVYAATINFTSTSGATEGAAARQGFLVTGMLLVILSIVGLILALRMGTYKAIAHANSTTSSILSQILKRDVYTVHQNDKVLDALRDLVAKKVSGMPVVNDSNEVVGFISDGDIMRFLADQHATFRSPYSIVAESGNSNFNDRLAELVQMPVGELATRQVVSVDLHMKLGEICRVLGHHHLKKAPVLENGKMVGIINRSNITRYSVSSYLTNAARLAS
jgi:DHA2 family lincomycin resistance protein-like MFS transporter